MSTDQDKIEALTAALFEAQGVLEDIARVLDKLDWGEQADEAAQLRLMRAAALGSAKSALDALGWESRKGDAP